MLRGDQIYIGYWLYPFKCRLCPQYTLLFDDKKLKVDSETIEVNNFYLHYSPKTKGGIVWKIIDGKRRAIHRFEIKELTPELAKQWVDKLRKYVIFQ